MFKQLMTKQPKTITGKKKKIAVAATAITTLISATFAFVAIKKAKRDATIEDKSEIHIILDSLVEDGTITQPQQIMIQSAITTAKDARTANDELASDENDQDTITPVSSKTGTLTKLKKSLFNVVESEQPKKPAQNVAI